jgi:hypothetical protein
MSSVYGSLARKLDGAQTTSEVRLVRTGFLRRLALLRGPDKYKVLERRRRAAQIKARHALDLIELMECASKKR